MVKFSGVYSAIFSIYDKNMTVISDSVKKLVDYQLNGGLKGFYVCGGTGECVVLPNSTRIQMLEKVVEANNGRGRIIAHIGAGHIEDTLKLLDHANNFNIDGVASLPPSLQNYYNDSEILEYYKILAARSKYPLFAYINKAYSGNVVQLAKELYKIDNIGGIKYTMYDYFSLQQIRQVDLSKTIFNGPDEMMICGLSVGADGAIGTTYNFMPKTSVSIFDNFKKGNNVEALSSQNKLNSVINICLGKNLAYWKSVLEFVGIDIDMGYTVSPAKMPDEEDKRILKEKLSKVGFFEQL